MVDLNTLREALMAGDGKAVVAMTKQALQEGIKPDELLNTHMIPALDETGRKFECNELFVPELLLVGRAMRQALEVLKPLLTGANAQPAGRIAVGTVKGDLHDIGKNLVASMLEGGGFEVHDLGVDVPPEKFVAAVKEKQVNILALSALLTTTMPAMKNVIDALSQADLRDKVKVIVGGAPVTADFATEIGADGYSDNANGAVAVARRLVAA